MTNLKNRLVVIGAFVLLCAAGLYVLRNVTEGGGAVNKRVSQQVQVSENHPSDEALEGSNTGAVSSNSDRYQDLYERYATGVLANDLVSINQLISLTGACETVRSVIPGIKIPVEVKRMQEFCALHVSNKAETAYQLNELWQKSYSMKIKTKLEALEKAAGKDAVGRELSVELRTANAYQAQMALEYAANAGVIPEELGSVVDKSDPSLSKQLSIASHIEFCRRGGACGSTDFESIRACVALPPCRTKLDSLEVIQRASAPRDYEAAVKISKALHRGS